MTLLCRLWSLTAHFHIRHLISPTPNSIWWAMSLLIPRLCFYHWYYVHFLISACADPVEEIAWNTNFQVLAKSLSWCKDREESGVYPGWQCLGNVTIWDLHTCQSISGLIFCHIHHLWVLSPSNQALCLWYVCLSLFLWYAYMYAFHFFGM